VASLIESNGVTNNDGFKSRAAGRSDGRLLDDLISVVVACKDEAAVLRETHLRLAAVLQQLSTRFEVVYVDDGSTDSTFSILTDLQSNNKAVRVVRLSRNFGHQIAITAGLEHACGDAVVLIDADLQDPPEVIPQMVERWLEGYDVVYGQRTEREGETTFKLWTAKVFYRLINRLSKVSIAVDVGDFRLMSRQVVEALLRMPERDRFLRGMVSWLGFRQVAVPYRRARRLSGQTKYPFWKMVYFALDGIVSFSAVPLKIATIIGFSSSALALVLICYALYFRFFTNQTVPGWTAVFTAVLFMGGAQLISLGIIGEYVGRIYGEIKRRPLYLVQELLGFRAQAELESAKAGDGINVA
jgi:glycosyltransferase involved in cell wall biosynthesis